MFKTRLISGIILVILAVLFICLGGNVLLSVTALISLIGMYCQTKRMKMKFYSREKLNIIFLANLIFFLIRISFLISNFT